MKHAKLVITTVKTGYYFRYG